MGLFNNNRRDDEVPQQDLQELFQRLEHLERKCRRLEKRVEELERTLPQPLPMREGSGISLRSQGVQGVQGVQEVQGVQGVQEVQGVQGVPLGPKGRSFEQSESGEDNSFRNQEVGLSTPLPTREGMGESLYLPAPTPDGLFTQASEREQIGKSIYQLTTQDGRNGSFILLDTPDAIATAMISVSTFVKPVCRVSGPTAQLPRHIVTEEEGTATREGTAWRVVRKAVVRFE